MVCDCSAATGGGDGGFVVVVAAVLGTLSGKTMGTHRQ